MNILLGAWLLISAFAWPHSSAQMANTWIVAVITMAVAAMATNFHIVNAVAGLWLVVSAVALPRMSSTTAWNNLAVGIAIVIASLLGRKRLVASPRRVRPTV